MELETPVKTSFVGIAAINISGFIMNSFLDVPTEMNKETGTIVRGVRQSLDMKKCPSTWLLALGLLRYNASLLFRRGCLGTSLITTRHHFKY